MGISTLWLRRKRKRKKRKRRKEKMRRQDRLGMWGWLLLTLVLPARAQVYSITDLGTLGGKSSFAFSANALGQVVGSSDKGDGNSHAFLWTKKTGMQDLGTLGG